MTFYSPFDSSFLPVTNDGLSIKCEHGATAKQLSALQQWPLSEYRSQSMINIETKYTI
jgi:hypothetical protein